MSPFATGVMLKVWISTRSRKKMPWRICERDPGGLKAGPIVGTTAPGDKIPLSTRSTVMVVAIIPPKYLDCTDPTTISFARMVNGNATRRLTGRHLRGR